MKKLNPCRQNPFKLCDEVLERVFVCVDKYLVQPAGLHQFDVKLREAVEG
ncbi:MAG: hypothetical protein FWG14_10940 [Peptococcaceae bacterium]|nr:hypothetical protein [Peptococcaceae bacterium]